MAAYSLTLEPLPGDLPSFLDSNRVCGTIDPSMPGVCAIYEFSSGMPGCGHAETALRFLAAQYGRLIVIGAGEPGDLSLLFWLHMLKKGIVAEIFEDEGARHPALA